jgi:serine/threonine-protein kinase
MTVVFTQGYAPPEQMVGRAEPRSDLFSLAATLYHLATGKEPNGCDTADEIRALLNDPAAPILPQDRWFFELLRINLAADPNDRYYSAAEFRADLERRCVTTHMHCPKCRTVNKVRTPYCVRCAAPLTETDPYPCRGCGATNRLGNRCCIHCGNRLR